MTLYPERTRVLKPLPLRAGRYVLYWLQASQRALENHALEHAITRANDLKQPLLVAFGLMDDYPEANARHYHFLLEGLKELQASLEARGIRFVVQHGAPPEVALRLGKDASLIVCDRGYTRHQKAWRERVAEAADCPVEEVETDVVVPVETVSDKREYAARTIRPKLHKHLPNFLKALTPVKLEQPSLNLKVDSLDLSDVDKLLNSLKLDRSVAPVPFFKGGTEAGLTVLKSFLEHHFSDYAPHRNQPQTDSVSHMSKYLHYGQLSPITIALEMLVAGGSQVNTDTYLEEIIVRRELTQNFVYYTPDYDRYSCLPEWAQKTLDEHRHDERLPCYSRAELEEARTHDPYWNASMNEMRVSGYMHNYMRMYWGKKILEWTASPEEAFETTLYLNNKYFLDGRNPISYASVAWVFGLHDRPWAERAVFGKVRYMNAAGLKRKADPDAYVAKVARLMSEGR